MKRFILAVAAIAAVCAHGAPDDSAVANRKWVRQYVSSVVGELPPPTSVTTNAATGAVRYEYAVDGAEIGISNATAIAFTFSYPTNPALAVLESTVPGLPKGEIYRYDGLTFISTNALLPSISCSMSNVLTTATNELGATSVTTNRLIVLSATDAQGRAYTSAANDGLLYLFDDTDDARYAVIVPAYVEHGAPSASSVAARSLPLDLLRLLMPTAHAAEGYTDIPAHFWSDTEVVQEEIAIRIPVLEEVKWRDNVGYWHTFDLPSMPGGAAAQMMFKQFSVEDFRNVENPLSLATFLDPKTWFGDVNVISDENGNKISLNTLKSTEKWRDLMKRLHERYRRLIEYMKKRSYHRCQFRKGDCNCIWMDHDDIRQKCPFKNPQHQMKWRDKNGVDNDDEVPDACCICVRCKNKYGGIKYTTVHSRHPEHCGCVCGFYAKEKDNMPDMMHLLQEDEDECWCECKKKHLGAKELCKGICRFCFMRIDDSKEVPKASEHTPFAPGEPLPEGVEEPDRCGCLCGYVDEHTNIEKFHNIMLDWGGKVTGQGAMSSCWCFCGRRHANKSADKVYDFGLNVERRCSGFCAVCSGVNPSGLDVGPFDAGLVNGLHVPSLHDPSDRTCGCACGAISADAGNLFLVAGMSKFHKFTDDTCTCDCTLYTRDQNHVFGSWTPTGTEPGYILFEHTCSICGHTEPKKEPCTHLWGDWKRISDFQGGTLYRRTCSVCDANEDRLVDYADMQNCNTNINLHIPADDTCGCKCGHYGTRVAEDKDFHKWDASDMSGGIANCHCMCGAKHEWREGCVCPNVCAFCKEIRKDGSRADQTDHLARPAIDHRCGCKCGYYGVTADHATNSLHYATSPHLHIQAKIYSNGSADNAAYCQCYGADGKGGKRHYSAPKSGCPDVCQYKLHDDPPLGHLAATDTKIPETGFLPARSSNHNPKQTGCGCACYGCTSDNYVHWQDDSRLHKPAANATDRCHCECSHTYGKPGRLVGHDEGCHTFATDQACTCTCGEYMRNTWLNACKVCSKCKMIHKNGITGYDVKIADAPGNHDWTAKASNNCKCRCLSNGPEHTPGTTRRDESDGEPSETYCNLCDRYILRHMVRTYCKTCGAIIETSTQETGHGPHPDNDEEDPQTPIICGEPLKTGGTCGVEYTGGTCPNASNHVGGSGGGSTQGGQTGGTGGAQTI